ncbi:MAG: arginase family protein [Burkholderiaceae bacterium]
MRTNTHLSLIGAPTDIGAASRGASMGPEALRVANILPVLQGHGLEVLDRGNLVGPTNPWLPATGGYRHLAEVAAWNRTVHDAVLAELRLNRLPVLLGGDHCLGIGSISAVARHCRETGQRLRVLWLDAHADFNTQRADPQRQPPRHAGGLPVRTWTEGIDRAQRPGAGHQSQVGAPDRHPQRRRRREAFRA